MITEKIKANSTIKHNFILLDTALQNCGLEPILENEFFNITPGFNEEFWLGVELKKPNAISIWFLIQSDISIALDGSSEIVLVDSKELKDKKVKNLFEIFLKSYIEIVYYGNEKLKKFYFFDKDKNLLKEYSRNTTLLPDFLIKRLYTSKIKYFQPIVLG
jgi:hypothetical protein